MGDRGHDFPMCNTVTSQLVGSETKRFSSLTLNEFPKESSRRTPVTTRLDEDVEHVTVLIDGAPEILPLTVDAHENFVQEPRIAEPALLSSERSRVLGTELSAPAADRLVGDCNASFHEQILDIPKAEAEPVIDPDCMTDDFTRISVSVIRRSSALHPAILAGIGSS